MDGILHYIWSRGILTKKHLLTEENEELHIISPGKSDTATPNLFKEAKIEITGTVRCGNVMLHSNNEGVFQEERTACSQESIILHVFLNRTAPTTFKRASRLIIECPEGIISEFHAAEHHARKLPCEQTAAQLPATELHSILSHLLAERMESKKAIIERIHRQCDQRWDDTLLKAAIRSFGFGIQSDVFDEWASLLDVQALGKHSDNTTQIEAIFFGQAGLLNDESIPYYYRQEALNSSYYNGLKREFAFLSHKFGLKSIDYRMWGNGYATPHLRIARLATLYNLKKLTISSITSSNTLNDLYKLLRHPLNGYWQNHTCFGGTETSGNGYMKQKQIEVVIINAIVPLLHIYGKHRKEERLCERAEELLHQLSCEENSIIKRWRENGLAIECAADSQALLQLSRNYCRTSNCIKCPFAYHYIKSRMEDK